MKAMCPDISTSAIQTADAMLDDLEKFRKDPAVDMDYIREDLKAAVVCQEPTQPLPTNQVAAVSRANSAVAQEEEDKKHSRQGGGPGHRRVRPGVGADFRGVQAGGRRL